MFVALDQYRFLPRPTTLTWWPSVPAIIWLKKNMIQVSFEKKNYKNLWNRLFHVITCNNLTEFNDHDFISGEGSHVSGGSEDRAPAAMARAVTIHANAREVMYFA